MDMLKKLFPYSLKATDIKSLVIIVVIYLAAGFLWKLITGLLSAIPVVGIIFSILGWVAGVYFFVGIVLAVLNFLGVLKV